MIRAAFLSYKCFSCDDLFLSGIRFQHRRFCQLPHHLLSIPDRVIRAERDDAAIRDEELDATFHDVLDIEGPRIHKVAGVDHEDVAGEIARGVVAEGEMGVAGGAARVGAGRRR